MIAILAQTEMNSRDTDLVFSYMLGRTEHSIRMRRVQIAQRMIRNGHSLPYVAKLLHFEESETHLITINQIT
uniref:Uncharacterized protein n=1 Tax=viral metagenome TaxID=1070528 RepID=A0A6C0BLJ4_9ZZZZ